MGGSAIYTPTESLGRNIGASKVNEMDDILDKIFNLPTQEIIVAVDTLSKIIQNVLEHPTEEKYRQVKTTNKRFHQAVWRHSAAREFLTLVGWTVVKSLDEEKIVLQSDDHLQEASAALVRAKDSLESQNTVHSQVPQYIKNLVPQNESSKALFGRIAKYWHQFPKDLHEMTLTIDILGQGGNVYEKNANILPYKELLVRMYQSAVLIFEERESLLLRRRREATVEEFQRIDNRLAQLATQEHELAKECLDKYVAVAGLWTDVLTKHPDIKLPLPIMQAVQDQYEELRQRQASQRDLVGPSPASPVVIKPLDFSAYVSSLPASAQSLLDKELDWDHNGVDVHLEKIAYYMKDWETKLSSLLKLTEIDIADLKWTHHDSDPILLRRAVLGKWKEKEGFDATYGNLLKLCCKGGDARSANSICAVLKEKVQEMEDDVRELEEGTVAPSYSTTSPLPSSQSPKEASRPDPLLQRPHPLVLSREMGVLCEQWRDVGLYLDLAESTLDEIQSRPDSTPSACMTAMLKKWLTKESPVPTWKDIIEVVEFLEHQDLATKLKEKASGQ